MDTKRPSFIISTSDVHEGPLGRYPNSDEDLSSGRNIGKVAGLLRIGLHIERLLPGHRTSFPHAEEDEEEFVFVLEGEVDAWVDGHLYPMASGDLAAFPAGTGIAHTILNNGEKEAILLVGGERSKAWSRIIYPKNPERRDDLPWSAWWELAPKRDLGPHDGRPRSKR